MTGSKKGTHRIQLRKTPQQGRSMQRVEHILAAARLLIVRHGLHGLKMTEIAAEAGVPIGSVYQYFPERAAIIKALFDGISESVQEKVATTFRAVGALDEALAGICGIMDWYYDLFLENPANFEILIAAETDRDLMRLNMDHKRKVGALFHESIRHLLPDNVAIDMERRVFLFGHLIGSAVRLAVVAGEADGPALLEECKMVVRETLFRAPGDMRA